MLSNPSDEREGTFGSNKDFREGGGGKLPIAKIRRASINKRTTSANVQRALLEQDGDQGQLGHSGSRATAEDFLCRYSETRCPLGALSDCQKIRRS